jgi:hypothetical protein
MFTYQQQPRTLHRESGDVPLFPEMAAFEVTLSPSHIFGEGVGGLGILMADRDLKAPWSGLSGRAEPVQTPPIKPIALGGKFFGGDLVLNGSQITLTRECGSLSECLSILDTLRLVVPAVMAVFLPRPVVVSAARVRVGGAVLNSQLKRSAVALEYTTEEAYVARVGQSLIAADVILEAPHHALIAACSYVHLAERLSQVGSSPVEFIPEMILNLAKAVEALFGSSRDTIRAGLTTLGYSDDERDGVFIPLVILRNEVDVGHAKLSTFTEDVLARIHSFVSDAPLAVKELIVRAINATIQGTWHPRAAQDPSTTLDMARLIDSLRRGAAARGARVGNRPYLVMQFGETRTTSIEAPAT